MVLAACTSDATNASETGTGNLGQGTEIRDLQARNDALEEQLAEMEAEIASALERARQKEAAEQRLRSEIEVARRSLEAAEQAAAQIAGACLESAETPSELESRLRAWLIDEESEQGEVPGDLVIEIEDAAGNSDWWIVAAGFSTRFEPGIFIFDPEGRIAMAWGGVADSESEILRHIAGQHPEIPIGALSCIDVSGFVES